MLTCPKAKKEEGEEEAHEENERRKEKKEEELEREGVLQFYIFKLPINRPRGCYVIIIP